MYQLKGRCGCDSRVGSPAPLQSAVSQSLTSEKSVHSSFGPRDVSSSARLAGAPFTLRWAIFIAQDQGSALAFAMINPQTHLT